MGRHSRPRDHRGAPAATAVTVVCAAAGMGLMGLGLTGGDAVPPQPPAAADQRLSPPSAAPAVASRSADQVSYQPPRRRLPRSAPVALHIPAIDLHTRNLVRLGLTPDGRLEAPQVWQSVGWYTLGPTPGQRGPAVMAGHVDSDAGPAVFYQLGALRPGDKVAVRRADGRKAVFTVHAVGMYPKSDFPTRRVYGPTGGRAELRLVTCGGAFNEATQHYTSNIVAYARLTAVHRPGGGP